MLGRLCVAALAASASGFVLTPAPAGVVAASAAVGFVLTPSSRVVVNAVGGALTGALSMPIKKRLAVAYKKCLGEVYHEGDCNEFRARKYLGDAVEAMQKRFQRVSELDRSHSSFKTAEMLYKHAHNQYMHVHECISIVASQLATAPPHEARLPSKVHACITIVPS